MTIKIVNTPKNKPSGKWCPFIIDVPMEVADRK
jgi:hypothetical protein